MSSNGIENFSSKNPEEININEKESQELELGMILTDPEKARNKKRLEELVNMTLNKNKSPESNKEKIVDDNQDRIDKIRESIKKLLS
jgi:antitoxin component of MazEF toxin-antitoxin module